MKRKIEVGYEIIVRLAVEEDIESAKQIADKCQKELSFVNINILKEAQNKGWLLVAVISDRKTKIENIVGFANFRIRKDNNGTLYEIGIKSDHRRKGVGKELIGHIIELIRISGGRHIRLKCPEDLSANMFYQQCNFKLIKIEDGKKRRLNVWSYEIPNHINPQLMLF